MPTLHYLILACGHLQTIVRYSSNNTPHLNWVAMVEAPSIFLDNYTLIPTEVLLLAQLCLQQ